MRIASVSKLSLVGALLLVATGCTSSGTKNDANRQTTPKRDPVVDAYVSAMRDDLSSGKVRIIGSVMRLTDAEAKTFWPIYQEYEEELFALGDKRLKAIEEFMDKQSNGTLNDREAQELSKRYFDFETQRIELVKRYHDTIAKFLSPVRAAQFAQIEHRVGTVLDLVIAANLPLIQHEEAATSPAVR